MTATFRPAERVNTPLIVGLAGPTKSGKTLSALRVARGLAGADGVVAMVNAEGAKGHQYADDHRYITTDIQAPFRPDVYTDALEAALALKPRPAVVIIDSMSHMHDGPGGMLEWHEERLDELCTNPRDQRERDRKNWTAWIRPKASENRFIYAMLAADCHLILCFRAKEKLKIVAGKPPQELGYQPIAGERIAFETIFTLLLPPRSKGVPDLALSELRSPFDTLIPEGRQLDEQTGAKLAAWAAGGAKDSGRPLADADPNPRHVTPADSSESARPVERPGPMDPEAFRAACNEAFIGPEAGKQMLAALFPDRSHSSELTDDERGRLFFALALAKEPDQASMPV